jgi:hypothetical protein
MYGENIGLMQSYGEDLRMQIEDIRITDRVLELQEQDAYSKVHTLDEIRKEHYGDKPIGDERGRLLPVEVKATPAPFGGEQDKGDPRQNNQDNTKPPVKADYVPDLIKWREKAVKRGAGKEVDYKSDLIPADIHTDIINGLKACKSNNDIRLLFQRYVARPTSDTNMLIALLENAVNQL